MEALLHTVGWTLIPDLTRADNWIASKLAIKHEPHTLTVLIPGMEYRIVNMLCQEPQRISDLLGKHGLTCSSVWDSNTALSTKCLCVALIEHNMTAVYTNVPTNRALFDERNVMPYWKNMKYVKVRVEQSALRHSMKNVQSEMASVSHPEMGPHSVPHMVYYSTVRPLTMNTVLQQDGRFVQGAHCVHPKGPIQGLYISDITTNMDLTVVKSIEPEGQTNDDTTQPFACYCCNRLSDTCLPCGHLCCSTCTDRMARNNITSCGICRATLDIRVKFYVSFDASKLKCDDCGQDRRWAAGCSHVMCICKHPSRCEYCDKPVTMLMQLFLAS